MVSSVYEVVLHPSVSPYLCLVPSVSLVLPDFPLVYLIPKSSISGQPMKCTLGLASPDVERTKEGTRCDSEMSYLNKYQTQAPTSDPLASNVCIFVMFIFVMFTNPHVMFLICKFSSIVSAIRELSSSIQQLHRDLWSFKYEYEPSCTEIIYIL